MYHDASAGEVVPDWSRQAIKEKIAQNEAAVEEMRANFRTLENKRYELLEVLNNTSQIMTMLSPEILSEIFIIICADEWGLLRVPKQFILARVCRAWRRIAWSTPRLWCKIGIRFAEKRYDAQRVLFEEWIKRSGNCPLELNLDTHYSEKQWEPPADSTLEFLMTTCHRWRILKTSAFPNMAVALQQYRPQFPLLDALHLKARNTAKDPHLKKWTFCSATPQLRSLGLFLLIPGPQLGVSWGGLIELRVTLSFLYQPSIEILALLPSLEYLHCCLEGYNANVDPSSVPAPNLRRLSFLFVNGHPKMVVTLLNLITTPELCKLQINFDSTASQVIWTAAIVDLTQRSSCRLTEVTLIQSNITHEGHVLDMLGKLSPYLKKFYFYSSPTFTLSNRTINYLNLTLPGNQRRQQECLPNLERFVFRGNISFTLRAMLRMLKSRRWDNLEDEEDEYEEFSSSEEEDDEADSSLTTLVKDDEPRNGSRPPESKFTIRYLNLSWHQTKNPNKMRDFYKKVTDYAASGVSLHLDWEKPETDDEGSE